MRISYDWLKDYIELDVSPEELGKDLTLAGFTMDGLERAGDDFIYDLDVTTNRPDCMNHFGIVREIAAMYDLPIRFTPWPDDIQEPEGGVDITIDCPEICSRYSGYLIEGLSNGGSPGYIAKRLESLGLRSVNGIVDIANYVLFELGHPLHAFDYERLDENRIVVRKAAPGERITTIDGKERELNPEMMVIADGSRPVAIAGVMGGLDTEVGPDTSAVLLESAYFDPVNIRRTSKKLNMHTEASHRFERGADVEITLKAIERTAELIIKHYGGEVTAGTDAYPVEYEPEKVKCRYAKVFDLTGKAPGLDESFIDGVFGKLEIGIAAKDEEGVTVEIPSFRRDDLKREIDLIEEISRHYGYNKIDAELPAMSEPGPGLPEREKFDRKLRNILSGWGFCEIITYGMVNERRESLIYGDTKDIVALTNPLSDEASVMRKGLIQGMMDAVKFNLNAGNTGLMFYELGRIYRKSGEEKFPEEPAMLCMGICGSIKSKHWRVSKKETADVFHLKGAVEELLKILSVRSVEFEPAGKKYHHDAECLEIKLDGEKAGFLGRVCPNILDDYDIERNVYLADLHMEGLYRDGLKVPRYESVPRLPAVDRELSFMSGLDVSYVSIKKEIDALNIEVLERYDIYDVYKGEPLPPDKKSFLISLHLQPSETTLTGSEAAEIEKKIVDGLEEKLGLELRGTVDDDR